MARSVKFNFSNIILESDITKVDRKKLYGSSKKNIKDSNGNECLTSAKLKRDIKVSNDKKQILTLLKDEIDNDIKKGWTLINKS